jgi:predicted permease
VNGVTTSPVVARRILFLSLPREIRNSVAADMEELYQRRIEKSGEWRAAMWYRAQAISFAARFLWERVRPDASPLEYDPHERKMMKFGISWLDWKLGARMLVKYPGLSIISGIALAGAIGLGAGTYDYIRGSLHPRIPLDEGDRLVELSVWDPVTSREEPRVLHDFMIWRDQMKTVKELGAYRLFERNLASGDAQSVPVRVAEISASAFPLARVSPLVGRALVESDEQANAPAVAVLSYDVWQSRFRGERSILGRQIQLGRTEATVVGVMPKAFSFPRTQQVWVPLHIAQTLPREGPSIGVFGRLADGATLEQAQAELELIGKRIAAESPQTHAKLQPDVYRFGVGHGGSNRGLIKLLLYSGTFLVLIVACANVATLVFARTAMRESEIVVRNALGATRRRVMAQLFAESLVLCSVAAVAGLVGATVVTKLIARQAVAAGQEPLPFWVKNGIEPRTLFYAALLAVVGAVLIGLIPAIKATGPRVARGLQSITGAGGNMHFGGVWSVIIVMQVALTVVALPIGFGISQETLRDSRRRADFVSDRYLTLRMAVDREQSLSGIAALSDADYRVHMSNVYAQLKRRILEEPGIAAVTFADRLPGMAPPYEPMEMQKGASPPVPVPAYRDGQVNQSTVDVDYFRTFNQPIISGRDFSPGDVDNPRRPVVINESYARNIGGNPLGVRIRFAPHRGKEAGPWHEVVGVVKNFGMDPTDRGEADFMFTPASPADVEIVTLAVRVNQSIPDFAQRITRIAARVDPGIRTYDVLPLKEVIRRRDLPGIIAALGLTGVVFMGMVLSAAGLYSLMAVAVARRTREIGIRVAMGATARGVLAAVFARSAFQLGVGILVGNLLVLTLASVASKKLQLEVLVPMAAVSAFMVLVGTAACAVPAMRALKVQPTEALKGVN